MPAFLIRDLQWRMLASVPACAAVGRGSTVPEQSLVGEHSGLNIEGSLVSLAKIRAGLGLFLGRAIKTVPGTTPHLP